MRLFHTPYFLRAYGKLPLAIKEKAKIAEKIFRENPFSADLKMHKLSGRLRHSWAFSIDVRYRIICEFLKNGDVYFHDIGDHSIYR